MYFYSEQFLSWSICKSATGKIASTTLSSKIVTLLLLLGGVEPNPGPSHNECRSKVCCVCYTKSDKAISPEHELLVKENIDPRFDRKSDGYPDGLCDSCRFILIKKNISYKRTPLQEEYADASYNYIPDQNTKSSCTCKVCAVANSTGLAYFALKKKLCTKSKGKVEKKSNRACPECFTLFSHL